MAPTSGSTRSTVARSGGKIVSTYRRRQLNPYERPRPPSLPSPTPLSTSPYWFSSLIVPAAKILSSVFDSSSSSDGEDESVYEDDASNYNDDDIYLYGVNEPSLAPETSSGRVKCMSKEPGLTAEKSERKHVVEQLLMQEMFSREEADRLIRIIKSRVLEQSCIGTGEIFLPSGTPEKTVDIAVMEAKKWYKEKRAGESPASYFGCGVKGDVGSPADMAKSYMRARDPWASSPSMKMSSLASGAWNLQDEIQRMHNKATENMLQPLPPSKADMSLLSQSPRISQEYLVANRVAMAGENVNELNSFVETRPVDESAEFAAGAGSELVLAALEFRHDAFNEASSSNEVTYIPEEKQDSEAFRIEGEHATSNDRAAEQNIGTSSGRGNGSADKEVKECGENANDLPSSQARLSSSADGVIEGNHRHTTGENLSTLSNGNSNSQIPFEEYEKLSQR